MIVGQELDVANVEDHVQRELGAGCFQDEGSALLLGGERGNQTCVREAGKGADVVWVPSVFCVSYQA